MAPTSSSDSRATLAPEHRQTLLRVAAMAIQHEIDHGEPPRIAPADFDPALREHRATFVTLKRAGELYGCIGTIEPREALVASVARNAGMAAFRDPRFHHPRLRSAALLEIHISILSPLERMTISSEADLLRQLRPGADGLLIEERHFRATFLPAVWESLPEPATFLMHLKRKAGLSSDYWSPTLTAYRYTAEEFP